jgi:hypothetical protein
VRVTLSAVTGTRAGRRPAPASARTTHPGPA